MNTSAIKSFAIFEYNRLKDLNQLEEDNWVSFSDDWDLCIYDIDDRVTVCVYPVIDKQVDTSLEAYRFIFTR